MRRSMEFEVNASMMASPRIGTVGDAPLAATVSRADPAAARGERTRDQRVFHAERCRDAIRVVPIWRGYATRRRVADWLLKAVWPAARQTATRTGRRPRAPEHSGRRPATRFGDVARF